MLVDIPALAKENLQTLQQLESWPEIELSNELKSKLIAHQDLRIVQINKGAIIIKTEDKEDSFRVPVPLESFFLFNQSLFFLKELKRYINLYHEFTKIKDYPKLIFNATEFLNENKNIEDLIDQDFFFEIKKVLNIEINSLVNFIRLIADTEYRGSKQIINGNNINTLKLRSEIDFFSSIILTGLNIPAASSSSISNLFFQILMKEDLFLEVANNDAIKLIEYKENLNKIEHDDVFLENILFYGPPGTGKTREIQINYLNGKSDEEKEFITFHQSYSYEEFIEGIKPNIGHSEKVLLTLSSLRDFAHETFKIALQRFGEDVVLKDLEEGSSQINTKTYKGNKLRKYFGSHNIFGTFDEAQNKESLTSSSTQRYFDDDLELEDRPHSYFTTQWANVGHKGGTFPSLQRFIKEISKGELEAIQNDKDYLLINKISTTSGITYEFADGIFYRACKKAAILAGYSSLDDCTHDTPEERNAKFSNAINNGRIFIFCIDEINRANVASVFGELITLIETDKRLGAENEMMVKLPYSKRVFGVPANLQLIGSMNTADRSITLLDSALRRRFKFKEIGPDPSILEEIKIENIELHTLLNILNKRISYFLGKDLSIGHAYFLSGINSTAPLKKDLLNVFINKIIPLLEEYFYSDLNKVRLVLGDANKDYDIHKFYIRDRSAEASKLFNGYNDDIDEKEIYILNPDIIASINNDEEQIADDIFIKIYK